MSSASVSRAFPWHMFRGPTALFACFLVANGVWYGQWWLAFGVAAVAFATGLFEGFYDEELPGGFLGPMNASGVTWLFLTFGVPTTFAVAGLIHHGWLWFITGVAVLAVNAFLHIGFRERGLGGLIVVVCLLGLAAL